MAATRCSQQIGFLLVLCLAAMGEGNQDVEAHDLSAELLSSGDVFLRRTQPQAHAFATHAGQSSVATQAVAALTDQASHAVAAAAHWRHPSLQAAKDVRDHFLNGSPVCGGTQIKRLLSLDSTDFQTISNIDFGSIQAQADDYVASQGQKIKGLEAALQKYAEALPVLEQERAQYAEALPVLEQDDVSEVAISKLLTDAMTKGFGGVRETAQSLCGLMRQDSAYDVTKNAWKAAVSEALRGKKAEMPTVQRICIDMLEKCELKEASRPTATTADGFCPRLCEELAGMASSLAMAEPEVYMDGERVTLGKVLSTIEQLQKDLKGAQVNLQACADAREDLLHLGAEIGRLKSEVDQQSARQRKASQDLYRLKEKLEQDSAKLDEQQKRTQAVSLRLREAKGHADGLASEVDQQAKEEAKLAQQTKAAEEQLVRLMVSVKASGDAVRAVQEFKGDLSITMKSMLQIFEDVVQTPLQDLTDELDRLNFDKWPKAEDTKSKQNALRYAESLAGKCDAAHAATKKTSVDYSDVEDGGDAFGDICRSLKKDWKVATKEIVSKVNDMQEEAIHAVKLLKADLHALGCSDKSKYKSQLSQGEPENLRAVGRLFEDSQFYREYASIWLLDTSPDGQAQPGSLLKLYQTLKEVYEKGELESKLEREQYNILEQQHAKVLAKKEQLGKQLTVALKVERCEGMQLTEAQEILDRWQADVDNLRAMKATLEPQEQQARVAQDHAKQDIVSLHAVLQSSLSSFLALGDFLPAHDLGAEIANAAAVQRKSLLLHRAVNFSE